MVGVVIIIIQDNNLWGVRRGGKFTNIVYRGKKYGIWKWVRGTAGFVFGWGILSMSMGGRITVYHNQLERGY